MRIINTDKTKNLLIFSFLSAILFLGIISCTKPPSAEELARESQALFERSVKEYNSTIAKGSDLNRLYHELGSLYYEHGKYPEAITAFKNTNNKAAKKFEYLTADIEEDKIIAQADVALDSEGKFVDKFVTCRYREDFPKVLAKDVQYMDVSAKQLVSVAAALIPFLEHDDANRALMGSNMQRQAVPLMITEAPLVGTDMEAKVAQDSGTVVIAQEAGKVTSVDASSITVGKKIYHLKKFLRTNADTSINQRPLVSLGDRVEPGQAIADGVATKEGELALGKNVLVAFMPWRGYNFEDAILISEKLIKKDTFTSIHIEEFDIEAAETRLGNEEITRDIPNVSEEALKNLDEDGIIRVGAEVSAGDILVGKITPKTDSEPSPEERLLRAIFGEKAGDVRDTSLVVPPGVEGVVIDVHVFQRKDRGRKTKEEKTKELAKIRELKAYYKQEIEFLQIEKTVRLAQVLGDQIFVVTFRNFMKWAI